MCLYYVKRNHDNHHVESLRSKNTVGFQNTNWPQIRAQPSRYNHSYKMKRECHVIDVSCPGDKGGKQTMWKSSEVCRPCNRSEKVVEVEKS